MVTPTQRDLIDGIKWYIQALEAQGLPCIFIYANNNIPTIFGDYRLVQRIYVDSEFRGIAYWIQRWLLQRGEQVGIVPNIPNGRNIDRYSRELNAVLNGMVTLDQYAECEQRMLCEFRSNPLFPAYYKKKMYYDYLYLDPRVLCRMSKYPEPEPEEFFNFYVFVRSIFYIGKGKGERAIAHLQETRRVDSYIDIIISRKRCPYSVILYLLGCRRHLYTAFLSRKLHCIMDIWLNRYGVIVLQVFNNTSDSEAHTREAAMIDAIEVENLTNENRGIYTGAVRQWSIFDKKKLGTYLLYKAYQSFKLYQPEQMLCTDF